MFNPVCVSNNFLIRSFQEKSPITSMKTQKMLYFLHRDYLKETGLPLFAERFLTWKYGPVLESVHNTYKKFGSGSITTYGGIPAYSVNEDLDPVLKHLIDDIWQKCLPHNGIYLSQLTHKPESAWYKAWANNYPFLLDEDIKNDSVELS